MVAAGEIKNKGSLLIRHFSLQMHSFASVVVVNVERREGPKSCSKRSGQTDCWNRDPSVVGKRPRWGSHVLARLARPKDETASEPLLGLRT